MTIKCKLADHGRLMRHYGSGQEYVDFVSVGECMALTVLLKIILAVQRAERESSGEVILDRLGWARRAYTNRRINSRRRGA